MRRLLALFAVTLAVVAPTVPANAATTIRGPLRGPTDFCPAPPNTLKVSGAGHGRYTLTVADDGTVNVTLVVRGLDPNTAYHVYVSSLVVLNGEVSECTSTELGAFIPDGSGDATFGPDDAIFTLTLQPGTYELQVLVTSNLFSHVGFLSPPKTVPI
jgi:hypothetical protein